MAGEDSTSNRRANSQTTPRINFQGNDDDKPISIIITTLAARAYRNQPDIYQALTGIVRDIDMNWGKAGYVENRNGTWWVPNPVDDGENFADKWNEYPERREAFRCGWRKSGMILARPRISGH